MKKPDRISDFVEKLEANKIAIRWQNIADELDIKRSELQCRVFDLEKENADIQKRTNIMLEIIASEIVDPQTQERILSAFDQKLAELEAK